MFKIIRKIFRKKRKESWSGYAALQAMADLARKAAEESKKPEEI